MFKGLIALIICVNLLVIFGGNVLKLDYIQKKFYPKEYWSPKIQEIEDKIPFLRNCIYEAELDIEEAKLLGKYAIIDAENKAKDLGQDEQKAVRIAQQNMKSGIILLYKKLDKLKEELINTQELIRFVSQFKKG